MSVPDGFIDPPEDLVGEGREAYLKWEESLGPLPEPEELEAAPCEPGCLNDLEPPPEEDVPLATVVARQALEIKHLWEAVTQLQNRNSTQARQLVKMRKVIEVALGAMALVAEKVYQEKSGRCSNCADAAEPCGRCR